MNVALEFLDSNVKLEAVLVKQVLMSVLFYMKFLLNLRNSIRMSDHYVFILWKGECMISKV